MTDEPPKPPAQPASAQNQVTPQPPTETAATVSPADPPSAVNQLTAEEQMERFEKELKENDWGHQPC